VRNHHPRRAVAGRGGRARRALVGIAILAGGAGAIIALPGVVTGQSGKYRFGAKVTKTVQPSNSLPAHRCEIEGKPCTWILNDAYGRPGQEQAKRNGTIRQIKLVAGGPGSFKLQVVKVKPNGQRARLKRNGPKISYQGQTGDPIDEFKVEKFKVKVPVKKGEQLAIKARRTSALRCSSGGDNNLQVSPPLKKRQGFRRVNGSDGCWLLLDAKVRT